MEAFVVADPVRGALRDGRPVVALETSVLAQGLPHPRNLEALEAMTAAVLAGGAEPAWVWVDRGELRLGGSREELVRLATEGAAAKVARRDLPMTLASGRAGATTVSATLWAASRAGVEVMATGGIGGVHPGTGDVSADLLELARTPGTVVCSGPKSIVDPALTLERIEELGIGVIGYRCDRLPFFVVREVDIPLDHLANTAQEAAAAAQARAGLGVQSALLVCSPLPQDKALPAEEVRDAVAECERRAHGRGVHGKEVTPFLLACLAEVTQGRSLEANLALLESNAAVAAEIAACLSVGG
jgi:pseudouridine-5'-phosphate glycosidase